jgi:hypothetical protein
MFNNRNVHISKLVVLAIVLSASVCLAEDVKIAPVSAESLPVNAVANKNPSSANKDSTVSLVSPSKPNVAEGVKTADASDEKKSDFDFDLKMKAINAPQIKVNTPKPVENNEQNVQNISTDDLPKDIQYKSSPMDNLGNSILSQMDEDLFTQMSEIEKSTTLLTLELKREKIRNEIEAQKAIRQKNQDDIEKQKSEQRIKEFERKKQIENEVLIAKQNLLDREQLFEILKQRKLLNAYMNQMLLNQQEWLKEKEALYAQIASIEQEKKDLIKLFKQRIDKVLEASATNIQVAEAARANFERVVKNLKARNEQLRKRVEADAQIIKNAKNMYIQSQSIEELKDKNAANRAIAENNAALALAAMEAEKEAQESVDEEVKEVEKISSKYALLRIAGRAGAMSIEVIGVDGMPLTLKVGSPLPTGHVVTEIGADFAKFHKEGYDDYLYIGRTIDGYSPILSQASDKNQK